MGATRGLSCGSAIGCILSVAGLVLTCIALGTTQWMTAEIKVSVAIPERGLAAGDVAVRNFASLFQFTRYIYPDTPYQVVSTWWYSANRYSAAYSLPDGTVFSPWSIYQSAASIFSLNIIAICSMVPMIVASIRLMVGPSRASSWSFGFWSIFVFIMQLAAIITLYASFDYQTQTMAQGVYYLYVYPSYKAPTTSEVRTNYSAILFNTSFAIFGFTMIFIAPLISALNRRFVRDEKARHTHQSPYADQPDVKVNVAVPAVMYPAYPAPVPTGIPVGVGAPVGAYPPAAPAAAYQVQFEPAAPVYQPPPAYYPGGAAPGPITYAPVAPPGQY